MTVTLNDIIAALKLFGVPQGSCSPDSVSTNSYTCYQITASNNHLVPTPYSKYGFTLKHYICTVFYNPRAAFSFQINSKVKRKNSPSHVSVYL